MDDFEMGSDDVDSPAPAWEFDTVKGRVDIVLAVRAGELDEVYLKEVLGLQISQVMEWDAAYRNAEEQIIENSVPSDDGPWLFCPDSFGEALEARKTELTAELDSLMMTLEAFRRERQSVDDIAAALGEQHSDLFPEDPAAPSGSATMG